MSTQRTYQLPDGKSTISVPRYVREWNRLMKPFAKTFDLNCHSCNPGARFQTKDGRMTFDVPLEVLRRFNADILPRLS